mmetsp:Transcript_63268/g.185587  ORF Transcript_63268/g.185587 Transcript_63268/m.185587 type:complete len:262 (+) Transcript_63268:1774-2559(+)
MRSSCSSSSRTRSLLRRSFSSSSSASERKRPSSAYCAWLSSCSCCSALAVLTLWRLSCSSACASWRSDSSREFRTSMMETSRCRRDSCSRAQLPRASCLSCSTSLRRALMATSSSSARPSRTLMSSISRSTSCSCFSALCAWRAESAKAPTLVLMLSPLAAIRIESLSRISMEALASWVGARALMSTEGRAASTMARWRSFARSSSSFSKVDRRRSTSAEAPRPGLAAPPACCSLTWICGASCRGGPSSSKGWRFRGSPGA